MQAGKGGTPDLNGGERLAHFESMAKMRQCGDKAVKVKPLLLSSLSLWTTQLIRNIPFPLLKSPTVIRDQTSRALSLHILLLAEQDEWMSPGCCTVDVRPGRSVHSP